MKSSNIGGQAVLEGIMMRHGDDYGSGVFSVFIIKTTDAIVPFENISGRICEDWYIYSLHCIDFKNG